MKEYIESKPGTYNDLSLERKKSLKSVTSFRSDKKSRKEESFDEFSPNTNNKSYSREYKFVSPKTRYLNVGSPPSDKAKKKTKLQNSNIFIYLIKINTH